MSDYGHALQFGVFITPSAADAGAVVDLAVLADASGLDLVTFQDHPYQARFLDAWTLLSVVAARTSRVRVAPNVLNLPLRPPAVVARAAASLDILSGGRVELGLGAGAFWDGIEAMGGPRRDARAERRRAGGGDRRDPRAVGRRAARRGPRRGHPLPARGRGARPGAARTTSAIWIGAYKPRMLALTGRKADGWLPSHVVPAARRPGRGQRGHRRGRGAARAATPRAIRRLLNVSGTFSPSRRGWLDGPPGQWVEELTELALADGIGTFILAATTPRRSRSSRPRSRPPCASWWPPSARTAAPRRRRAAGGAPCRRRRRVPRRRVRRGGVRAAGRPADRRTTARALSATAPWDESTRPRRAPSGAEQTYTDRGQPWAST